VIYELNHFGIVVRDLEASLRFYRELFGAEVVFRSVIPSTRTDVVYLQIAGGMIELLHPAETSDDEVFGITHIAFLSDALDDDYARLTRGGCVGLVPPKVAGTGVGRLAFLSDPNGARVELLERDVRMRDGVIDHPIVQAFDHYSVIADDRGAALRFYGELLGMRSLVTLRIPADEVTIDYLNYGYDVLELLSRPTPSGDPIFSHIAFRVDSVEAAADAFGAAGVDLASDPRPAGTGLGMIGVVRDPDGVAIELLDRPDLREL
jgi:catechol 2,3-dioxygenase-like lactoylglutathione lyase family enzyme